MSKNKPVSPEGEQAQVHVVYATDPAAPSAEPIPVNITEMQVQIRTLMEEFAKLQLVADEVAKVPKLVDQVTKLEEASAHPLMVFNPRMVDYHLPGSGDIRPAIIVQLHGEDLADLQVFTNGQADRSAISERIVQVNVNTGADQHVVPALIHRPGVRMGNKPGQWSWPGGE